MTREIKFRGKIAFGGYNGGDGWIYGNLTGSPTHPYIQEVKGLGNDFYHLPLTEVIPKSVGQYTGLHDKNGKEIYEGDIVKTLVSRLNSTKNKKYRNFMIRYDAPHFWNGYDTLLMSEWKMEVIGNIYDNPELLEGGEQ